jgi:hypothetical protein
LDSWAFKKGNPGAGTVTKVDIPYGADCAVSYTYDAASNSYLRFVEGEPFTDKPTGVQIAPKNVVVMYVSYESSDDGEEYGLGGRDEMQLIGEGRAVIFRDGEAVEGRWLKPSESGRTMFLDAAGSPVSFNRGQTWIQIVPESWEITLNQP